jgi:C_GCAxxG_C_C family probable redox protein
MCVRVATAFGAGMAYMQDTCGTVTGALMVIGLKHGRPDNDRKHRDRAYGLAREFVREFTALHTTISCRGLIEHDLSTKKGQEEARSKGIFKEKCPVFVRDSVKILERLL